MDADDLFARGGEHAERVGVAQVALHREREFGEVGEGVQIGGMHAGGVELLFVERGVGVGVGERPFEALELQGGEFVARGGFDRLEVAGTRREILHRFPPWLQGSSVP